MCATTHRVSSSCVERVRTRGGQGSPRCVVVFLCADSLAMLISLERQRHN
jgi:hypothetical protein